MQRKTIELGDGDSAVTKTIHQMMCRLALRDAKDARVRRLAASLKAPTEYDTVKNIFTHVVRNMRYVSDPPDVELVAAPIYLLSLAEPKRPYGDCDDMCVALAALLAASGIAFAFRVIAWRRHDYTHVNARAYLKDGRMIPLDPVLHMSGWDNEKTTQIKREREYRCKPDTAMKGVTLEDSFGRYAGAARGIADCGCGCGGSGKCGGRRRGGGGNSGGGNAYAVATATPPANPSAGSNYVTASPSAPVNGNGYGGGNPSPITLNIVAGSGIDVSRRSDYRSDISADDSRSINAGGGSSTPRAIGPPIIQRYTQPTVHTREIMTREIPKPQTINLPPITLNQPPATVIRPIEIPESEKVLYPPQFY